MGGLLPQPANNPVPIPLNPQPMPNERQPGMPAAQQNAYNNRPCFACQQYGHFARECPNRDQAKVYKPANQQVNQVTQPAAPTGMHQQSWSKAATTQVTSTTPELVAFCVNCAQTGHSMSDCKSLAVPEEQVFTAWSYHAQATSATQNQVPKEEPDTARVSLFLQGRKGYFHQ